VEKDPSITFPIAQDHSSIVKFTRNDPTSRIVYSKLRDIPVRDAQVPMLHRIGPAPERISRGREHAEGKSPESSKHPEKHGKSVLAHPAFIYL
jgi:hypothetical protein